MKKLIFGILLFSLWFSIRPVGWQSLRLAGDSCVDLIRKNPYDVAAAVFFSAYCIYLGHRFYNGMVKKNTFNTNASIFQPRLDASLSDNTTNNVARKDLQHLQKTEVYMWDQRQISVQPNEQTTKVIFTNGLCGCTALALIAKTKSGACHVMMSHYPPVNTEDQVNGLKETIFQLKKLEDSVKKTLIVVVPGEWKEDVNKKWIMESHNDYLEHIKHLEDAAGVKAIISAYSTIREPGEKFFSDFSVELTQNSITWQSFADYHMFHSISHRI